MSSKPTRIDKTIEQALLIDPDWSYCTGEGRCSDEGGIYDSNLNRHVMSSEQVQSLIAALKAREERLQQELLDRLEKHYISVYEDDDHRLYQFDEDGNILCVEPVYHIRQPAKKLTTNQEGEK